MILLQFYFCIIVFIGVIESQGTFMPETFCVPDGQIVNVFKKMVDQSLVMMMPAGNSFPGEIFIIIDYIFVGGIMYSLTHKNNWWVRRSDIDWCNPVGPNEMLEYRNTYPGRLSPYTAAICMNLRAYPLEDQLYDLSTSHTYVEKLNEAININGLGNLNIFPSILFTSQVSFESNDFRLWSSFNGVAGPDNCTTPNDNVYAYRGKGPLKIEGKCEYIHCQNDININVAEDPNMPSHVAYGFSTSLWKFLDTFVGISFLQNWSNEFLHYGLTAFVKSTYDSLSNGMLDWDGYDGIDRGSLASRRYHFLYCSLSAIRSAHIIAPEKGGCFNVFGCGNETAEEYFTPPP